MIKILIIETRDEQELVKEALPGTDVLIFINTLSADDPHFAEVGGVQVLNPNLHLRAEQIEVICDAIQSLII